MFRFILALVIFLSASPLLARIWTIKGKTVKANYVGVVDHSVVLKNRHGTIKVPVYELGYKDLEFVTQRQAEYLSDTGNYDSY